MPPMTASLVLLLACVLAVVVGQQDIEVAANGTAAVIDNRVTFDRILIVVLENQPLKASLGNKAMRKILAKGTLLTNYYALVNPSQPNYIGLIAGDLMGVNGDDDYDIEGENLVDLLEAKNITWKSYQENFPGNCYPGGGKSEKALYKRKHNPFMSFNNIRNNPERCAKIVEASQFEKDLAQGTVPQYSFYTPNMDNNGHDTSLAYAAKWLDETFLDRYEKPFNATGNSLMVITFDEGVSSDNKIYTLFIGGKIPAGYLDETKYDHYSLLRLVEDNFNLSTLNRNDARATQITKETWKEGTPDYPVDLALLLGILLPGVAVLAAAGVGVYFYRKKKANQKGYAMIYNVIV